MITNNKTIIYFNEISELKVRIKQLEINLTEAYNTIDGMAETIRKLEDERFE